AVVRDYRAERNQHVVAMLDNGRIMAGTVGATPRVEHAMDAVLGLTQVASRIGDNVGLLTFDSQVRGIVPARSSKAQFGRVAEAMYLLDPALEESAYRAAFNSAAARFRRRSLFVVFTDLAETVVDDSLLPALVSLTRTHLVMVAAVRDPDVADWAAERDHAATSDIYRSAAAVGALESRERTIARLGAAGAVVVDARPGELAVDVVDQYLELKAKGRL
ncbi:MAG: VWA domain-containing protein, partial [Ilumatobacter sp.]|nr:VWA domain-containing protein [Ilumatobacter sp.]